MSLGARGTAQSFAFRGAGNCATSHNAPAPDNAPQPTPPHPAPLQSVGLFNRATNLYRSPR
ncbi:hypothetical protein C6Y14_37635 [Streptomyces dioscori]|uniref:Uncharacterized protein n=1 Tax=Streptomyces dioscori TaxID=2109333 RepID=A0A2P8PWS4_9ACTN|nr:hypothetical protein C6Y14_37635 [Streptomyces dioscori]